MSIRKKNEFHFSIIQNSLITHNSKQSRHFLDHPPMLGQFDLPDYPDRFSLLFDRQQYRTRHWLHRELTNTQSDNNPFRKDFNH